MFAGMAGEMLSLSSMRVSFRNPLKRAVALLVVTLTCFCLAEDLLAPSRCAEDQEMGIGGHTRVISQERSPEHQPPNSGEGDYDCLCCCRHVVTATSFVPERNWSFSFVETSPNW